MSINNPWIAALDAIHDLWVDTIGSDVEAAQWGLQWLLHQIGLHLGTEGIDRDEALQLVAQHIDDWPFGELPDPKFVVGLVVPHSSTEGRTG